MKLNIKSIYIIDNIMAVAFLFVPEKLLLKLKTQFHRRNKRSDLLSSSQSFFRNRIIKGMNNIDFIIKNTKFDFKDSTVLEFGTGGHCVDLILFYLLGAKKLYTVDIRFFGCLKMPLAIRDFESHLASLSELFDVSLDMIQTRFDVIKEQNNVQQIFNLMNIEFLTFDELRTNKKKFNSTIDLFYSESNLQRIPKDEIDQLFANVGVSFSSSCIAFHRLDCKDIKTQKTQLFYDPDLWYLEYLKYSETDWNNKVTKRFGSQNRMRKPQFFQLFESIGFRILYSENYYTSIEDVKRIEDFELDESFHGMSNEEIAITNFRFVASKDKSVGDKIEKTFSLENRAKIHEPEWNKSIGMI